MYGLDTFQTVGFMLYGQVGEAACKPFTMEFCSLHPLVLLNISPVGLSKPDVLRLISPMQVPGVQVPDIGHKFLLLRKKLCICEISWLWVFILGVCLWWDHVSATFTHLIVDFVLCCRGALWLVFGSFFFFNRECSLCSCRFAVSMRGGEFRTFLGLLLNHLPRLTLVLFIIPLVLVLLLYQKVYKVESLRGERDSLNIVIIHGNSVRIKHYWNTEEASHNWELSWSLKDYRNERSEFVHYYFY